MINGHFFCLNRSMDSSVYFSSPCIRSTTKIAMSQRDEPLDLKLVNDSWPGVSITRNPGNFNSRSILPLVRSLCPSMYALGKNVAPICCVIPPASPAWTLVLRNLSRIKVLPVSTWPRIQTIGHLSFAYFYLFILSFLICSSLNLFSSFLLKRSAFASSFIFPSKISFYYSFTVSLFF